MKVEVKDLTNKQIVTAQNNGISRQNLLNRVFNGWDIERAITAPIGSVKDDRGYTPKEKKIANENGVSTKILNQRIDSGWELEKAIHTPVYKKGKFPRTSEYSKWEVECRKNKVSYSTFKKRIEYGWSPERAATTPPRPVKDWRKEQSQKGG